MKLKIFLIIEQRFKVFLYILLSLIYMDYNAIKVRVNFRESRNNLWIKDFVDNLLENAWEAKPMLFIQEVVVYW